MIKYLLPKNGNFYKANLHMHTTVSDGLNTPEEVKKAYMEKGYSVVAFTDHDVLVSHKELTDENFVAITAFEKAVNKRVERPLPYMPTAHMNLYAEDEDNLCSSVLSVDGVWGNAVNYISDKTRENPYPDEYSTKCLNDIALRAKKEGFLITLNHPVWSLQNYEDYCNLKGFWGIEVFNTGCVIEGYPDTVQPFEDLLRKNQRIFPLATDDAHGQADRFGGWVMLKADALDYSSVINALKKGNFYSSFGPEITEIYLDEEMLVVKCSPACSVVLSTQCRRNMIVQAEGENAIEVARFNLSEHINESRAFSVDEAYFRVTVRDFSGKEAYSRAFFIDEL